MRRWLKYCSAWQFALVVGGLAFIGCVMTGAVIQWLWHGHLDFSVLLGSGTGSALAIFIISLGHRITGPQSH